MKTGGEMISVDPTPIDETGAKLEPEERIATEAVVVPIDVTIADHPVKPGDAPPVGSISGMVGRETTAGEVAQSTATRCELCAYWRHADWINHLREIEGTREGDAQILALAGELLGQRDLSNGIDDHDLVAVLFAIRREFGICAAFTESDGMVVASPFYGGCPIDDVRFKIRDREAQTIASAGYDQILRLAQGKG